MAKPKLSTRSPPQCKISQTKNSFRFQGSDLHSEPLVKQEEPKTQQVTLDEVAGILNRAEAEQELRQGSLQNNLYDSDDESHELSKSQTNFFEGKNSITRKSNSFFSRPFLTKLRKSEINTRNSSNTLKQNVSKRLEDEDTSHLQEYDRFV